MTEKYISSFDDIEEMRRSLDLAERLVGELAHDLAERHGLGDAWASSGEADDLVNDWLTIVRKTLSTPRAEIIRRKG